MGWLRLFSDRLRTVLFGKGMEQLCVYSGHGMYEECTNILLRAFRTSTCSTRYTVTTMTPEEIKNGKLKSNVTLLAIGGGFDLGLIEALGPAGMQEIKDFVTGGGHYLGICSGAYFATDYIEFDEGGPLQVCGERFLKFYPGICTGPLYKTYDYKSRAGAVAALIDFPYKIIPKEDMNKLSRDNQHNILVKDTKKTFKVYFNGGGCFIDRVMRVYLNEKKLIKESIEDADECSWLNDVVASKIVSPSNVNFKSETEQFDGKVEVLSRFQDLPSQPVAMVKCDVGKGSAILSGVHFEYEGSDIDDDDRSGAHLIPDLQESAADRQEMFCSLLSLLGITCK